MIPPDLRELIRDWIAEAKGSPDALSPDGRALRIYGDIGGAAYLTPEGEILSQAWDSVKPLEPEPNPKLRLMALVVGARKRPELRRLLPSRPSDAITCNACKGTGWLEIGTARVICGCGGIGWEPAA